MDEGRIFDPTGTHVRSAPKVLNFGSVMFDDEIKLRSLFQKIEREREREREEQDLFLPLETKEKLLQQL